MATYSKQIAIYASHLKMLISLALLLLYLLGDKRLVNQLLWDNKLVVPVCNDIVNTYVSVTSLVANGKMNLF